MSTIPQGATTIAPQTPGMAVWRVTVAAPAARLSYRVAACSARLARRKVRSHRAQAGEPKARTIGVICLHAVGDITL